MKQYLLFYLFKAFIRSQALTNRIFILRKDLFSFIRAQHGLIRHQIWIAYQSFELWNAILFLPSFGLK